MVQYVTFQMISLSTRYIKYTHYIIRKTEKYVGKTVGNTID